MKDQLILMGHGSGGRLTRDLINNIFVSRFSNSWLKKLSDAAIFQLPEQQLAFTTDSFVIDPVFFPGGDIGKLAVSGTVNDLCVSGAIPKYLSLGIILEEGFPLEQLEKIADSIRSEAHMAGVEIVTGDTKVVKRGQCDKIFINTSGIGIVPKDRIHLGDLSRIEPGDKIIVSGYLGDHAMAILSARENLRFNEALISDVAPLNALTEAVLADPGTIRMMRDITRGGLATVLCEICENKDFGISLTEENIPVRQSVQSVCGLYGFDPLYLANEGKIVLIVKSGNEERVLHSIQKMPMGKEAGIVGEITKEHPAIVHMKTVIGGTRIIDMLSGEMLPRIC